MGHLVSTFCGFGQSAKLLMLLLVAVYLSLHASSGARHLGNETDLLGLLEFKKQISDDPYGVLNSWNQSLHHCQWQGVTCSTRHQGRVTALTLSGKSLSGTISPHIGNLSFINFMQLGENRISGEIPQEIGRLFRLRFLNLSSNIVSGEIPVNLGNCTELTVINLLRNSIQGKIPTELGFLKKVVQLNLALNNLTGEIPRGIWNLTSLQIVSLAFNNLEGSLPNEMGSLTSLIFLSLGKNEFVGSIPSSIFNISTIKILILSNNHFEGEIPADIGITLPNLQVFGIAVNQIKGIIPMSITNASKLEILDLLQNWLEGQVPTNLGELQNLRWLNVGRNLLGSNSSGDLSFIASLANCSNLEQLDFAVNNFGGELPRVIGNLSSKMTKLYMGLNQISGTIPLGFGSLVHLVLLSMPGNSFRGAIPSDFGNLHRLQGLDVHGNRLSGEIPSSLCNISSLFGLYLSNNSFEGDITPILGNCKAIKELDSSWNNFSGIISPNVFGSFFPTLLDLSHNSLSGLLPREVGNLKSLNILNISHNKFFGQIPGTLGDCSSLEYLEMQGNSFQGIIPSNLASLKGLQYLDLSQNNLSGPIPQDIEKLTFLHYLNFSFNDLEGQIPTDGVFKNASQVMLTGNSKLCGGIPQLQFPSCLAKRKKKGKHLVVVILPTLFIVILICVILFLYNVVYKKEVRRKGSSTVPDVDDMILRVSYDELYHATSGFSPENLIGSGSFGFVYKGSLGQHGKRLIAVKVLNLQNNGASKSFKAECKALRHVRHRNLVFLLSYCSSIDFQSHEFKALVYEFMENGNLDSWLHPETADTIRSRNLNLLQRLNIAIEIASAVDYLHNQWEVPIVHCDLKPSNILLDNDLVAHVGDFGLARLLASTTNSSSEQGSSTTIAIKGSIGYAPPEYGMGLQVSTQGDIYSYGILLLEMFTGKRPIDDIFMDGLDLHNYVKIALPEQVFEVVDQSLLSIEEDEIRKVAVQLELNHVEKKMECLTSVLKIGVECSVTLPNERMHVNEIVRKLHLIRDGFLGAKMKQGKS